MRRIFAFLLLSTVKTLSHLFYRSEIRWLKAMGEVDFSQVRLMVFLNHTSLYEILYLTALPYSFMWVIAGHISIPGADTTLDRPIVGRFWKLMLPKITTITRKRDETWENYVQSLSPDDMVFIAPEGRMKRPTGLDKDGNPMTIRGGIVDILEKLQGGKMLLCHSGGLHHVQVPGQTVPKPFQTIKMNLDIQDIVEYKKRFAHLPPRERKIAIICDMQKRLEQDCPV